MHISKLQLFNFKNHESLNLELIPGVNILTGNNGVGKTNCLDAVHCLSNGKSYFTSLDSQLIKHGQDFFTIKAAVGNAIDTQDTTEILLQFDKGKKTIKKNGKNYPRLSDHIGFIQTVMITPYDIELVLGNSDERRRFMDLLISQLNTEYLHHLMVYRKAVEQRNSLLKAWSGRNMDDDLLESFDQKLIPSATLIHQIRYSITQEIIPIFKRIYAALASTDELVEINYSSPLHENAMQDLLKLNRSNDLFAERTTAGPHKDDWVFELQGNPLRKFGSQGQIKSFVIALKIAQYRFFQEKLGKTPILLLDDIFEKIDESRAQRLMELVESEGFGQILITDTHPERVEKHLSQLNGEHNHRSVG
ncbi:MAG: DNA replication/repair protein RecF [Bacteroidota bacterium]|jgi:DNA replication and repair protein RecF